MSDEESFPVEVWIVPLVRSQGRPFRDTSMMHRYLGEIPPVNWYDPDCDVTALAVDMAYHDLEETIGWPVLRSECAASVTRPPRIRIVARRGKVVTS